MWVFPFGDRLLPGSLKQFHSLLLREGSLHRDLHSLPGTRLLLFWKQDRPKSPRFLGTAKTTPHALSYLECARYCKSVDVLE